MLLHIEREGEHYVLRIDAALIEQAGLNEATRLEATVTGSALVIAPVPHQAIDSPAQATQRGEVKQPSVLRRLAE